MSEDKNCAAKSKKPILMLPKIPYPTAPTKKEGPAFTQKQSIFAAVFLSRKFSETRSLRQFAAAGYPPKIAAGKTPQQIEGIFKNLATGFKIAAKKSEALLLQMKTESAINGKSAGITEKEQRFKPFLMPSLNSSPLKRKIVQRAKAQSAVKKFCFVKKSTDL